MANEKHLEKLKQGVIAWNQWRRDNDRGIPDLSKANLAAANLKGVDLHRVLLSGANLSGAQLIGARLFSAGLTGANLSGADLTLATLDWAFLSRANLKNTVLERATLNEAKLTGAKLVRADLTEADLRSADLCGADLRKAIVARTGFANVDLSTVKGLETIIHKAPSTIGIDTIYRSKGKIPVEFLRGAGVPDNFIDYMSSLVGTAFEFYSCFISYSSKDEEFAKRLFADLQTEGVRCWFAPHHVQAGKKLHEQIDVAIRMHEKLLLILSPESINSEWVKTEIAKARKREIQDNKRVLFPVRLNIFYEQLQGWECFDADRGKDSAREIREYYIPDFTNWKDHDQYVEEFKKLLRDLKKGDTSTPTQEYPPMRP